MDAEHTYTAHPYKGVPLWAKNALQIMNLAAYACESNKGQSGPLPLDSKTQGKCLLSVNFRQSRVPKDHLTRSLGNKFIESDSTTSTLSSE